MSAAGRLFFISINIIAGEIAHEECGEQTGSIRLSCLGLHELVQVDRGLRRNLVVGQWLVSTPCQLL